MSFRLDMTVIAKTESSTRFALTLHNLTDSALKHWVLHFANSRKINAASFANGHLEQNGSYCVFTPNGEPVLAPNSSFYTEFKMNTTAFSFHDDGINDAFLTSKTGQEKEQRLLDPIPVEVTTVDLGSSPIDRYITPLHPAKAINIIPVPAQLTALSGQFTLSATTIIAQADPRAENAIRWLQSELEQHFAIQLTLQRDGHIHYQYSEKVDQDGYHLLIEEDHIWLQASTPAGFVHATASLLQLLPLHADSQLNYSVPMVEITDQPHHHYRGMMLDCARHFHPLPRLKSFINQLARYKFNVFHWHLTDDEGWRLEIDAYPELTAIGAWRGPNEKLEPQYTNLMQRYGGFYSKDDVRELIQYASDRGITIIPEIDIPGHCRAAIKSLPHLLLDVNDQSQYNSAQNYSDNILSAALPGTYEFIATVLQEVAELFPAPYVHIGGDEVPTGAWEKSEACQAFMAEHNYHDPMALQSHLLRFADEILQAKGKRMMGWEEVTKGGQIDNRTVIYSWLSEEAGLTSAQQGFDVIMQPAQFTYLDLVQGYSPDEMGVDWAGKLPLDKVYSYHPLAELSPHDPIHKKIMGIQGALWCERIHTQQRFDHMLYPRLLALAEVCWSQPNLRHWDDFTARLNGQLKYLDTVGIQYRHCE
ncbi:beta-N-acetylhexosaminidase [Photobacterium kagoshimensis]|uniref:beta-N-acetylhexosaminidase n=1 Tax=Photobacterium kagoshimensis TaxID=2910242 RepID=UPI003D10C26C